MLTPESSLQNRYRIIRPLGRGGMGAVYEAFDQRLDRIVALKETLADSDELRRAFEREARLLANLEHPALPRVTDHFIEDEGQYLVMDFVPGEDLKALVEKRGAFTSGEVYRWAVELLDVLEYLHSREPPVVHRDIKPANLKLNRSGRIMLLDFGLAKGHTGQAGTLSRSVLGYSPHYASLEQMEGERTGSRSDIYGLGATLYYLLTATIPADALTRVAAVMSDETDPLIPLERLVPGADPTLTTAITSALTLKPGGRFASAAQMRRALGAHQAARGLDHLDAEADETVVAASRPEKVERGPSVIASQTTEGARKSWFVRFGFGLLGVAVLALAIALYYARDNGEGPAKAPAGGDTSSERVTAKTETVQGTGSPGGASANGTGPTDVSGAGQAAQPQPSPTQQPAQVLNVVVNTTYTGGNGGVTTVFEGASVKITSSSGTVSRTTNAKGRAVFESIPCGEVISIQMYNGEPYSENVKGRSKTFKKRFNCGPKSVTLNVEFGDYEGFGWTLG